jgi:hypothetical protein
MSGETRERYCGAFCHQQQGANGQLGIAHRSLEHRSSALNNDLPFLQVSPIPLQISPVPLQFYSPFLRFSFIHHRFPHQRQLGVACHIVFAAHAHPAGSSDLENAHQHRLQRARTGQASSSSAISRSRFAAFLRSSRAMPWLSCDDCSRSITPSGRGAH